LAKEKFKVDLFDKRFAIYKGTQVLLSKMLKEGKCDLGMFGEFRGATQDAMFLFDDEIPAYLKEIDSMSRHIWRFQEDLKGIRRSKKRTELCGVNMELFTILTDELPNLKNVFAPYIKFDKWK
jgi:hypothetical protein